MANRCLICGCRTLHARESANVSFALGVEYQAPDCCKTLLENMPEEAFNDSVISGYRIAPCCSEYGGVRQRWLVVESQARKDADLKQLENV